MKKKTNFKIRVLLLEKFAYTLRWVNENAFVLNKLVAEHDEKMLDVIKEKLGITALVAYNRDAKGSERFPFSAVYVLDEAVSVKEADSISKLVLSVFESEDAIYNEFEDDGSDFKQLNKGEEPKFFSGVINSTANLLKKTK